MHHGAPHLQAATLAVKQAIAVCKTLDVNDATSSPLYDPLVRKAIGDDASLSFDLPSFNQVGNQLCAVLCDDRIGTPDVLKAVGIVPESYRDVAHVRVVGASGVNCLSVCRP